MVSVTDAAVTCHTEFATEHTYFCAYNMVGSTFALVVDPLLPAVHGHTAAAVTVKLYLQVRVDGTDAESSSGTEVAVQHLAVAREEPLMLAGCSNGRLQLYDLRQSQRAAASVQPHKTSMVKLHMYRTSTVVA